MRRTWKAKYTRSSKNRWLQHTLQFIFDTIMRSTFPEKDCTRHFVVSVLHHCVICHLSYKSYKRVVSWFDPKWLSNIGNARNAINLFFWKERGLPHAFLHLLWPLLIITPYTSGERYPGFLIDWIFYWIESSQIKNFESIFELNNPGKNYIVIFL